MDWLAAIDEAVRTERVYAYEELLPLEAVKLLEWAAGRIRALEAHSVLVRETIATFISAKNANEQVYSEYRNSQSRGYENDRLRKEWMATCDTLEVAKTALRAALAEEQGAE